jgi:hypothetical protein
MGLTAMGHLMPIFTLAVCANQLMEKKVTRANLVDTSRNSGGRFINYGTNFIRGLNGG